MRMQVRFEIAEGDRRFDLALQPRATQFQCGLAGSSIANSPTLWSKKNAEGYYLQHILHFYFIWNPRIHHQSPEFEWKRKMKSSGSFSMSASKCIERTPARA